MTVLHGSMTIKECETNSIDQYAAPQFHAHEENVNTPTLAPADLNNIRPLQEVDFPSL